MASPTAVLLPASRIRDFPHRLWWWGAESKSDLPQCTSRQQRVPV